MWHAYESGMLMFLFLLILWLHPMRKMIMHLQQFQNSKILKSMNPYLLQFVILHLQKRLGHGRWKIMMRQRVSCSWLFSPSLFTDLFRKHLFASIKSKNLNPIPHLNSGWKKSSLVVWRKKLVKLISHMTSRVCLVKGWLLREGGSLSESLLVDVIYRLTYLST